MNKTSITQRQRDNLTEAKKMWLSIPPENVAKGLNFWRGEDCKSMSTPTCNTIACFGGWCAWWPEFIAQGITVNRYGEPSSLLEESPGFNLFGHDRLFTFRGGHKSDEHINDDVSDWDIVMNRIKWAINNSKVI